MYNTNDRIAYELKLWLEKNPDPMEVEIVENVKEVIEIINSQNHSSTTLHYMLNMLGNLMTGLPLYELTGEDDEWYSPFTEEELQLIGRKFELYNKRAEGVFKDKDKAYQCNARIYVEPDGTIFTDETSSVEITFPYFPSTQFIPVNKNETTSLSQGN